MNIKYLEENRKLRVDETVYIYRGLLDKLWLKIQQIDNDDSGNSYLYQVPNFIFGEPRYDRNIAYLIIQRKLTKGGFVLHTTSSDDSYLILISWDPSGNKTISRKRLDFQDVSSSRGAQKHRGHNRA